MRSKISLTAWVVIRCCVALANHKKWAALAPQDEIGFYRHCLGYCGRKWASFRALAAIPDVAALWLVECGLAKGAPQHYLLRKQAIRRQIKQCMEAGTLQLVVIGGGFDALAIRTAQQYSHVRCFEIDLPEMHVHKTELLRGYYASLPANYHALGINLMQKSLYDSLVECAHFDRERPTIFVAEGVVMYLGQAEIERLFDNMRKLTVRSSFIFTAIDNPHRKQPDGKHWLGNLSLSLNRERFSWGIDSKEMEGLLRARGFLLQYCISYTELQKQWRTQREIERMAEENGEYLVYAITTES